MNICKQCGLPETNWRHSPAHPITRANGGGHEFVLGSTVGYWNVSPKNYDFPGILKDLTIVAVAFAVLGCIMALIQAVTS